MEPGKILLYGNFVFGLTWYFTWKSSFIAIRSLKYCKAFYFDLVSSVVLDCRSMWVHSVVVEHGPKNVMVAVIKELHTNNCFVLSTVLPTI